MKLTCPKCRAHCFVPDDKVPQAGAWAKCPQCAERFFIRPRGFAWEAPPVKSPPPPPPTRGRSPEAQALLNRLRPDSGQAYSGDENLIILSLVKPPNYQLYALVSCVTIIMVLSAACLTIKSNPSPGRVSSPATAALSDVQGPEQIRSDLRYLRSQTRRLPTLDRTVEFSGAESRTFKYFIQDLSPGACLEISSLKLSSKKPDSEFEMQATCLRRGLPEPRLRFRWLGTTVEVSAPPRSKSVVFELFPAAHRTQASEDKN